MKIIWVMWTKKCSEWDRYAPLSQVFWVYEAGVSGRFPSDSSETFRSRRNAGDNPRRPCCNPLGCSREHGDSGPVLEPWQLSALNPLMHTRRLTNSVGNMKTTLTKTQTTHLIKSCCFSMQQRSEAHSSVSRVKVFSSQKNTWTF